jgi:tetratricopeptide (TPR) repeat protein
LRRRIGDSLFTQLWLAPLPSAEAARVVDAAAQAARPGARVDATARATILREAAGNPFLLVELARLTPDGGAPTVRAVARRRLALLDDDEKALVELAAISPGPIDAELLHAALEAASRPLALDGAGLRRLCGLKILRETGERTRSLGGQRYEFYHLRLRETIRSEIPLARRRALHLRLADTLRALRPDDHDAQVRELLLGGDEARAAGHAEAAAEAAMAKLAHARAVELYRLALRHASAAEAPRLRVRLGQALEGTARFVEAANEYRAGLESTLLAGLDRTRVALHLASCRMQSGELEESEALVESALRALGHRARPRWLRALSVLALLLRALVAGCIARRPRPSESEESEVRLLAYGLAVAHFQFTSRNLEQLEFALRYRLLAARSPSLEVHKEAIAIGLTLLLPFAHVSRRFARRAELLFARLEAGADDVASSRSRARLPLLRALYAMDAGRPDRAVQLFDELDDPRLGKVGHIGLQRQNALFLAGEWDRIVDEARDTAPRPLDLARLAYIERMRGRRAAARPLLEAALRIDPASVPWTHRSLFVYQLVEILLLDGDAAGAARLARSLVPRIARAAVAPTTGAFESADAVARALLAAARGLAAAGDTAGARSLVDEAARAMAQAPLFAPPLYAPRLAHDRALVALAQGDRPRALKLFGDAELASRGGAVPCFRLRLCEDLLALLDPSDPRRATMRAEAAALAGRHRIERRGAPAPWLWHS